MHLLMICGITIQPALADDLPPTPEPTPFYENEPVYQDNTAAQGEGGDSAADINTELDESIAGTKKGEITLHKVDSGIEVFSGMNKVEQIENNSDGWVGKIEESASGYKFTPAGRPQLDCPAQSIGNWFGPCKVPEQEAS